MTIARLTFRDKSTDICWQKQLRDRFLDDGTPFNSPISIKDAIIRPVSRNFASQIIMKYEWLGTMAQTGWHYGIFFGSYCAGVCCYSAGSATGGVNVHKMFNVLPRELGVLARGACVHWAPHGANSKLVSISSKLFCKDTKCRLIIAYSDSDAGEIGTIYQACNWIYIGKGAATRQWVSKNGRVMDQKLPYDLKRKYGGTRSQYVEYLNRNGWHEQSSNPKHRYVYVSDKSLLGFLRNMGKPYPKRPANIESDVSAIHAE